jgi:hypothetical protein
VTTRPDFDPTVYETPELAEINRPLHSLAWDLIEVERELNAARNAHASAAVYNPIEARYFVARKAHEDALAVYDVAVAAYCESRPEPVEDEGDAADQLAMAL